MWLSEGAVLMWLKTITLSIYFEELIGNGKKQDIPLIRYCFHLEFGPLN